MQRRNASAGVRIVGKKTLLRLITKFTLAILVGCTEYALHIRFFFTTFGADLHAQSVLVDKKFCIGAHSLRVRCWLGLARSHWLLVQQHGDELLVVDVPVPVDVGLRDQLLALLLRQLVAQRRQDLGRGGQVYTPSKNW